MFNFDFPYKTRFAFDEGLIRYFVKPKDGQAKGREIEISFPVFAAFDKFERTARNIQRWDERHLDNYEFADERNFSNASYKVMSAEDEFFAAQRSEELRQAIQDLPDIQRRRFVLYYEFGLTYEQIARLEGRGLSSVVRSVERAKEKIREAIKFS